MVDVSVLEKLQNDTFGAFKGGFHMNRPTIVHNKDDKVGRTMSANLFP